MDETPPKDLPNTASPVTGSDKKRLIKRRAFLAVGAMAAIGAATGGGIAWYRHWKKNPPFPPPPAGYSTAGTIKDELRIVAVGDWGSDNRDQYNVIEAMDNIGAKIGGYHTGLFLGDNFYNRGVTGVDDPRWQTTFEKRYDTPYLGKLTWHAILGNHDWLGNVEAQIEYTKRSNGRWSMPGHYWRRDFGAEGEVPLLTVLALDSDSRFEQFEEGRPWREQAAWLEKELASLAGAPQWVVVIAHHPIYSFSLHKSPWVEKTIKPLIEKHKPHLYLAGHDHNLQMIERDGMGHAVVGGGGAKLYDVQAGAGTVFFAKTHGFGVLRARRDILTLDFYSDRAGEKLYSWARRK